MRPSPLTIRPLPSITRLRRPTCSKRECTTGKKNTRKLCSATKRRSVHSKNRAHKRHAHNLSMVYSSRASLELFPDGARFIELKGAGRGEFKAQKFSMISRDAVAMTERWGRRGKAD